jgi:hypothetical protein
MEVVDIIIVWEGKLQGLGYGTQTWRGSSHFHTFDPAFLAAHRTPNRMIGAAKIHPRPSLALYVADSKREPRQGIAPFLEPLRTAWPQYQVALKPNYP